MNATRELGVMSRATKQQRAETMFLVNEKLVGQARKDAISFVRNPHRSTRDLENFRERLKDVETPERECHFRAKLSDKAIMELRADRAAGASLKELATKYKISESHAGNVCAGRSRKMKEG